MEKYFNLLMLLLLMAAKGTAQPSGFVVMRPKIHDLAAIEKASYGSVHWSKSRSDYAATKGEFPNSEKYIIAQPITSHRKTKPVEVNVYYTYSVPDSIIRVVEYLWYIEDPKDSAIAENLIQFNSKELDRIFNNQGKTDQNGKGLTGKTTLWQNDNAKVIQSVDALSPGYHVLVRIVWE